MKVAYVQFAPVLGDLPATLERLDRLSEVFAQADLVVLPELCNSGYNFESAEQAWASSEGVGDGPFVRHLQTLCTRHACHVVSGLNERAGDRLYNSAVLVGPGGLQGAYRKLHLFMNEKDIFRPGDAGLPVYDLGTCRVGMLVCFDWMFPEAWRILALQGADVICHPANLVLPGLAQRAVAVHALVNRVYVVTANRVGSEGNLTFTGRSTIANPRGEVLAQGSPDGEEWAIADVDVTLARDKYITPRNHAFVDRRPGEYSLLTEVPAP